MTGREIYKGALARLFETEQTAGDYNTFALPLLNILLPELLGVNNQLRSIQGKEEMPAAPLLSSLEDDLEYEEPLCRAALPFGLAAKLLFDDNDNQKISYLNAAYVNAVNALTKVTPEQVKDVYQ